jgi:hypothetical protein
MVNGTDVDDGIVIGRRHAAAAAHVPTQWVSVVCEDALNDETKSQPMAIQAARVMSGTIRQLRYEINEQCRPTSHPVTQSIAAGR